MLPLKLIQEKSGFVIERLKIKNFDAVTLVGDILRLDEQRRSMQVRMDNQLSELNGLSAKIGRLFKEGKPAEAKAAKKDTFRLKEENRRLKEEHTAVATRLQELIIQLPNLPHELVPPGKTAEDNQLIREGGPTLPQDPARKAHWDLLGTSGLLDFELGVKLAGAGFPVYKKEIARLQRALINFFLDRGIGAGYTEVQPPVLVNESSAFGTGQLPDKEGQMYHAEPDGFYLIPTAEVPLTNLHQGEIIDGALLPLYYTAYTPCFRSEAGSAGRETRGMIRQHQFHKVELMKFVAPGQGDQELEKLTRNAETILEMLDLPYRRMALCTGDMGFGSCQTFDLEVWMPGMNAWVEISSCSQYGDFQARRCNTRFRADAKGRPEYVHTMNGSGLAAGRTTAAVLENYQQANGALVVPEALRPYMGGVAEILPPE